MPVKPQTRVNEEAIDVKGINSAVADVLAGKGR